jgi:endogenous inhibitor of DNA gyrase (YacG/DUF329 family)
MATILPCPTCQRPVEWSAASPFRPFCSERCRLIDLGAWFGEKHAIPGEEMPDGSAEPAGTDEPQRH